LLRGGWLGSWGSCRSKLSLAGLYKRGERQDGVA
jgi:hypothetical protein